MSRGTNFKQFHSTDREMVLLQKNIQSALQQLGVSQLLDGLLLENVPLVIGDNIITHKLNRKVKGWIVTRRNAVSNIYDKISTDTKLEQQFTLNSSVACTISLWVF